MIIIIDFGSQTTHLIGRRVRELGTEVEIIPAVDFKVENIKKETKGIILSGGPASVYAAHAPTMDKKIFNLTNKIPMLGICYGQQLITYLLDGKVIPGKKEFGPANLTILGDNPLLAGLPKEMPVWMSHGDEVVGIPQGFKAIASTQRVKYAAIVDSHRNIYAVQFHPEVHHTPQGITVLKNFVFSICQEKSTAKKIDIAKMVDQIKKTIGNQKAVCALSGGIDSAVAAILTNQAIGENLTCFYVDTGMMRLGETEEVVNTFQKHFKLNLKVIHAEDIFLTKLKGITDPEEKRKIIGETFIRVFETEAKKINAPFLVQGTIYPDVIESKGTTHADKIKTHHNVGGLPQKHGFKLIEPLRQLYKDEVRAIAGILDFPHQSIHRHVFPGPGLGVRIIGEVTMEKLDILRKADSIVVEEIKKAGFYDDVWMAFAIFAGIKTTGVTGDERKYGETIAVRVLESKDTMTADWVKLPFKVLAKISNRITNEVPQVVRVVYDITTKPPATMEWE